MKKQKGGFAVNFFYFILGQIAVFIKLS